MPHTAFSGLGSPTRKQKSSIQCSGQSALIRSALHNLTEGNHTANPRRERNVQPLAETDLNDHALPGFG